MRATARSKVTIRDVAQAAGVSPGTVSKVLNGTGQLRDETRQRVVEAARRLNFRPSLLRRDPALRNLVTIGVLTSDSYGRFTLPLMLGAEDAFGTSNIAVIMCDVRDDPVREQHFLKLLLERRVDALIVTGRRTDRRPSLGPQAQLPIVYAYQPSSDPRDCSIIPDNRHVAELAIGRLVERGCARIVHVTGPRRHAVVGHRVAAARAALADRGLRLAAEVLHGEWSEAWGQAAATRLLAEGTVFDGAFCGSDEIARGFVTGLREAGVAVPDRVAVVGVDNWTVLAEASRPPLTTVDLELAELGRVAAQILADVIDGTTPLPAGTIALPCRLVVRESA